MSKKVAALVLATLFLLSTVCYAATKVSITNEAFVTGQYITLGDIAEITGEDIVRIEALKQLRLGSAPAPGAKTILSREILTARLSASQTDFTGIEWGPVPEYITVTSGGQLVSGKSLAETAVATIKKGIPKEPQVEFTVALLQEIPDMVAPMGVIDYRLSGQTNRFGVVQTGYLLLNADGIQVDRIPIKYEIRRFASVLITNENIPARTIVTPDSVRLSRIDTSRLPAGYLQHPNQAVGLVVSRSLPTGSVLYSSYLEKPIIIKRGAAVLIRVNVGGIEATAPGIAQKDGREGQIISVRNSATGRVITARVMGKGWVEVPIL